MSRKIKEITITAEGSRDKGKTFVITELAADLGEDWALRALRLAQRSGADIPNGVQAGMAGIAAVGILTVLSGSTSDAELRPLFDDMMACVEIVSDKKTGFRRKLVIDRAIPDNDDIQEIGTRILLRKEWLNLHLDFSIADALSKLTSKTTSAAS
jgi:hypothetical protein